MEIRFFLTNQDMWNFQKYAALRTRTLVTFGILLIFALLVVLVSTISTTTDFLFSALPFLMLVLVLFPILVFLRMWMASNTLRSPALQGEHIITISPEGFRHRTSVSDASLSWRAIKKIAADKHNLYFIVQSGRVVTGHIIPRHAFPTPQHAESYLAWAQTYWAQAWAAMPAGPAGPAENSVPYERWR